MPVLMIALLALGAFAGIGILLATAVILESRGKSHNRKPDPTPLPQGK